MTTSVRLVGLLALTISVACATARGASLPSLEGTVAITRFRADAPFAAYSGMDDSVRLVIRDSSTWASYWARIHRPFIPAPSLPSVDFAREQVVLASLGKRASGGYSIRVESVHADSGALHILVRTTRPGAGCAVTAALTQPVDLVRMPASSQAPSFAERADVTDCRAGRQDP